MSGMELGADNGTSDGALTGHGTVVVMLGLADGAATLELLVVLVVLLMMAYCLASNLCYLIILQMDQ